MFRQVSLFLLLFLCFFTFRLRAQFVTIPDPQFVSFLQATYPAAMNGNMMDTTHVSIITEDSLGLSLITDGFGIQFFDNLQWLELDQGLGSTLPPLPATLRHLQVYDGMLTSLPTLPAGLETLYVNSNLLSSLPALPASLKALYCSGNSLDSLPQLPAGLEILDFSDNSYDSFQNLSSLPLTLRYLNARNNGISCLPPLPDNMEYINIQYTYIMCLPSYPAGNPEFYGDYPSLSSYPVCTYGNGCPADYNIQGSIYADLNTSCAKDSSEQLLHYTKTDLFHNNTLLRSIISAGGEFAFRTDTGSYTVYADTTGMPFGPSCTVPGADSTVYIATGSSVVSGINFGMSCDPGTDLGISAVIQGYGDLFPGRQAIVRFIAGDMSTAFGQALSCASGTGGTLSVTYSGPVSIAGFPSGSIVPSVSGNTLSYAVSDFGQIDPQTAFGVELLTDTTAQSGDPLCFDLNITVPADDQNTANNNYSQCFEIAASYDPNDKQVSPAGTLLYPYNAPLTYTVRFQNTGTAPAARVVIRDTIDSDLRFGSFTLIAASHPVIVELQAPEVVFSFNNIQLPDSLSDPQGSQGFVTYRILPVPDLPYGTHIFNTADIYFDFNPPIRTNTTENTIGMLSTENGTALPAIQLYPNPAAEYFRLVSAGKIQSLEILNMQGQRVRYIQGWVPETISVSGLPAGLYFIRIQQAEGVQTRSLVINR